MGEGGEVRLEDSGAKEEGGSRPESLNCCAFEFVRDDLEFGQVRFGTQYLRKVWWFTGSATDNEVPSRATIKVMTASVRKAR